MFGATVVLLDQDSEEEKKYTLVGTDEADLKEGKISVISPVGKALDRPPRGRCRVDKGTGRHGGLRSTGHIFRGMMLSKEAVITSNINLFGDYYLLEVTAKGIGAKASPGQFFMVKVGPGTDPLLRRPFGLHKIVSPDSIKMLYRAAGYGTKLLTKMVKGDALNILGPLGNGFKVAKDTNHALIVAGGIGVAPMVALAEEIKNKQPDTHVVCFIGGRGKDDILGVNEFRNLGLRVYVQHRRREPPEEGLRDGPA